MIESDEDVTVFRTERKKRKHPDLESSGDEAEEVRFILQPVYYK